jgi:hypothetical protein
MRNAYIIFAGNLEGRDHLGFLGERGRIILKYIIK